MKNNLSIIWDWNGTIVNDASIFIKIMNDFLSERNLPPITLKQYRSAFVFPVKNYYTKLGFDFSEESFESLSLVFIEKYKKAMFTPPLVKDIKNLLSWLCKRQISQYIVSAQEHSLLTRAVEYYRVGLFFKEVKGINNYQATSKVSIAKELYSASLKQKKEIVLIGDTEHDAEVAKELNINCFLVSYGHCTKEKLLKTGFNVFDSVSDLKSALKSIY
tara:strand:+ start:1143 stop:1793 length:651 start_codon:yes stop_codon:yes gene_type:complete